uniref:BRCT domain-containing protein n=1 Tax=Eutreptiella gymnastica TaxID=73025 RepID=A0A7S1IB94_9EUGL
MSAQEERAGMQVVQAAVLRPVQPLPDFLQGLTAYIEGHSEAVRRCTRLLVAYGAVVAPAPIPSTTHVVWAPATPTPCPRGLQGPLCVTRDWVEACHAERRRVPEGPYAVAVA